MLQKGGRRLPAWDGVLAGHEAYARTVAELLRKEHGNSHRVVKLLMRRTHASERAVKHWLSGQHGPDTVFFLRLMVSSPVIRAFVLGLIDRPAASTPAIAIDRYALAMEREAYVTGENAARVPGIQPGQADPIIDPNYDPNSDPDPVDLNERQRWFLARVATNRRCGASEIVEAWRVSTKSARRDIAALKAAGLICYVGSRRKGRYRNVQA